MAVIEPPLPGAHSISDRLEGNLIRVSCSCGTWSSLVTEEKFVKPVASRHLIIEEIIVLR